MKVPFLCTAQLYKSTVLVYFDQHDRKRICRYGTFPSRALVLCVSAKIAIKKANMIKTQRSIIKDDEQTIFQGGKAFGSLSLAVEHHLCIGDNMVDGLIFKPHCVSDWIFEADPKLCLSMHSSNWHE